MTRKYWKQVEIARDLSAPVVCSDVHCEKQDTVGFNEER